MRPDDRHPVRPRHAKHERARAIGLALCCLMFMVASTSCKTTAPQGSCPPATAIAAEGAEGEVEDATTKAKQAAQAASSTSPSAPGPKRYEEIAREAITFESRGAKLRGTLTLPVARGKERFPAVVILHDFGPMGQDGLRATSMGVELPVEVPVYELLAEELARSGVAVLRYDKRTCIKGAAPRCDYPREHIDGVRDDLATALMDDAREAVKLARVHGRIDPRRVGVLGHGQGATIALAMRGEKGSGVESVILLAPSVRPLDALIMHQTKTSLELTRVRRGGEGDTAVGDLLDKQIATLEADLKEQEELFQKVREGALSPGDTVFGMPASSWRGFFDLHDRALSDLSSSAKRERSGTLAIYGGLDLSLPSDEARQMETLLEARASNRRVEILDDVTHDMVFISRNTNEAPTLDERIPELITNFLRTAR